VKRLGNWDAVKEVGRAMKLANLDKRSHMTHITMWPKYKGKCVMKFVVNSSQFWVGVGGMGCRRPGGD